jgi:hypothetical protein
MNQAYAEVAKIQKIAWSSGLLFIAMLYLILNFLAVDKPREQKVPGFELLNWVRQVYKAPLPMARVKERMGQRAVRQIPGIDQQLKRSLEKLGPGRLERIKRESSSRPQQDRQVAQNENILPADRDTERRVTRGTNRDLELGDREGTSDRDQQGVSLGFGDGLYQDIQGSDRSHSSASLTNLQRFNRWYAGLAYWDISSEMASFTPCPTVAFKGTEVNLDGKRWRIWVCPPAAIESANAVNTLLFRSSDELRLISLSGEDLELQGLKVGELVSSESGFTIISSFARLADSNSLHVSFIEYLENF